MDTKVSNLNDIKETIRQLETENVSLCHPHCHTKKCTKLETENISLCHPHCYTRLMTTKSSVITFSPCFFFIQIKYQIGVT